MSYNILIPDSLHINKRNFPSFHKFIDREKAKVTFVSDRKEWIALYGDYSNKKDELRIRIEKLRKLTAVELFEKTVREVNLFFVARAEILSLVIKNKEWMSEKIEENNKTIFLKLFKYNKDVLLSCLAAAWDWIDYWYAFLQDNKLFTHCCIFSGSLIYQRSLIELLRYRSTRVFVMETFFTGNDYYCEEKYEPIANNSDIRYKAIYESLVNELDFNLKQRETTKAINKVLLSKNKNVVQPKEGELISFGNDRPIITILGQVVNDFSLLEYKGVGLSSIHFYTDLIQSLIAANFNVIFKAHPWEAKKINITDSFTKNKIQELHQRLAKNDKENLIIVDNYPISNLFTISDYIVGLNSQGLIEAAFDGFKPVQFGNAFYGKKGFTSDYDLNNISEFIEDLQSNKIDGTLTLSEYDNFETFLLKVFQGQLVSIHNSGIPKLVSIFESPSIIKLVKPVISQQKETHVPIMEKKKAVVCQEVDQRNKTIEVVSALNEGSGKELTKFDRKMMKFKKNPRKFFSDSDYFCIRIFKYFFKYK